ncbi:MAG: nucleotidyl transferase AbiEii/AbiGii toxin family protein [Candidatus Aenigmarchaeota archaeon]|nr:nucleotidyl transferase AbiEii/AbiGii toxin family protein [Candidatus Aenigmarchaeota archaeon]
MMLDDVIIRRLASQSGVPAGVIEKDYMITKFLYEIRDEPLVFKGGTAIKKLYIEGFRFSEDLDFTVLKRKNFEQVFRNIFKRNEFRLEFRDKFKGKESESFSVSFIGPLRYKNFFKIDLSFRERPLLNPVKKKVIHFYPDIENFKVSAMKIEELVGEKLRALYTRGHAKDIIDVFYLMQLNFSKKIMKDMFIKKLISVGIKKFEISVFLDKIESFDPLEINYLIPENIEINKKHIIENIKKKCNFLFR